MAKNKQLFVRATEVNLEKRKLTGYAIIFEEWGAPYAYDENFLEKISRGALDDVDLSDIKMYHSHNRQKILARTKNGSLKLDIREKGLYFEAEISNTTLGNDTLEEIRTELITGCSFGFWPDWESMEVEEIGGKWYCSILKIKELDEISVVVEPVYGGTSVDVEREKEQLAEIRNKINNHLNNKKMPNENEKKGKTGAGDNPELRGLDNSKTLEELEAAKKEIAELRAKEAAAKKEKEERDAKKLLDEMTVNINTLTREQKELKDKISLLGGKAPDSEERELGQFSLGKVLKRELDGFEGEVCQIVDNQVTIPRNVLEAKLVTRAELGDSAKGGTFTHTTQKSFIEAFQDKLCLRQAGANYLNFEGDGNVQIPKVDDQFANAKYTEEKTEAPVNDITTSERLLIPKWVANRFKVTGQFLNQITPSIENYLRNLVIDSLARTVEGEAINGAGGFANKGLLNFAGIEEIVTGANGGAVTFEHILKMKGVLKNVGKSSFVTSRLGFSTLQGTKKDSGSGVFLLENGMGMGKMIGYDVFETDLVPTNLKKGNSGEKLTAIIHGDFSHLFIGHWGGIKVIYDNITMAGSNEKIYTIGGFFDHNVGQEKAFSKLLMTTI